MRYPQLVVFESERWIADLLHGTAGTWKWTLRELRQPEACVRTLLLGGPSIMVLELGTHLAQDLTLLEKVTRLCPDTATVVVSHRADGPLLGLLWELGAAYVLSPPHPRDALLTVVLRLMETACPEGMSTESSQLA